MRKYLSRISGIDCETKIVFEISRDLSDARKFLVISRSIFKKLL